MKFQYITHKVSFILCVELQLATQLYNSVIRCDLLNGNSYAWSEKGKKGSGFIGHLGGQIIHREQIFTGWDHRPLLLNKLVINSLDDLEQISFTLRTSVPSKEFEKDHWQKSIRVLYRKFVRGKVVDNLKAYSCDRFNLYTLGAPFDCHGLLILVTLSWPQQRHIPQTGLQGYPFHSSCG